HVRCLKPLIRYGNAAFLPQLPLHLKQADIIHLHLPFFGGAEWLALTKPKAPLVISYHMDVQGSGFLKPVFKTHRKLFFKKMLNKADKILVSTRDYADHSWLAAYPEFQNRIEILPFGVDEAFLPAQNREEDEPCRFLFVA